MEALYHNLYIGCGIFAIIMFVVTIVLFFVLKIYKAFMDLTGISARRAIREMEEDADYTTKLNKKKRLKQKKGKVMTPTGRINYAAAGEDAQKPAPPVPPPAMTSAANETQVLDGSEQANETQVLTEAGAVAVSQPAEPETQLLSNETPVSGGQQADGTTLLTPDMMPQEKTVPVAEDGFFVIERTIIEIHTEEVMA